MDQKKSYIPLKLFLSYLVLVALFVGASWYLYRENREISQTETKRAVTNSKILRASNLLSHIYETENLARVTIQSDSDRDLKKYISKIRDISVEIDSLKKIVSTPYQMTLLDSVKLLLSKKTNNIRLLKAITRQSNDEETLQKAIDDLSKMESSLRKLQLEDFVKKPSHLGAYQLSVLKKYVAYLNDNIPDDSTNTLTKKRSDSIIMVSKKLLYQVRKAALRKKVSLNLEGNKLLQNELLISDQLRKVLRIIEKEIVRNTTKNFLEREKSLKRNNQVVSLAAILGLFSTLFFLVLILNDFSKSQSYKRQLEEANQCSRKLLRNREQLISTVSHDLKTPLSTIMGCTELLGNSELNKRQQYFANNIKGASQYISKLIQDLLDFTQIEAGKITIEKLSFSLEEVITEVAKSIQSLHMQKPIALSIEIDTLFQNNIIGDPFRLRQIVSNIVGNAYKFTEKGFIKIEVRADLTRQLILIIIEDSGIGIVEEQQQLIFEEFTQANEGIVKKYGGSGLGLTISKKMIELLGGTLNLRSKYNFGSAFEIQLPLVFAHEGIEPINPKKELSGVVVDDDPSLLALTSELLRQSGIGVRSFGSAMAAIVDIEQHPFDFIISDMQMPEMDGFEFIKKIQQSAKIDLDHKPIIALSGRMDISTATYKNAGFTHWIKKPFSSKELLDILMPGIVTEFPAKEIEQKAYSLASLRQFLASCDQGLQVFLKSFKSATNENILLIEKAIEEEDWERLEAISHRMGSMFKQIEATEVTDLLECMGEHGLSGGQINEKFRELTTAIENLFLLLEQETH